MYKNIKLCNNNGFVIDIADIIEQKINSLIKSKNIKIIKIGVNVIPYFIKNDKNKLLNKVIKNIASKKNILAFIKKNLQKMKKEVLPDFYFYGGKIMSLNYINNYTKSISIHTLDYDNYLIHQKTKYKNNLYNDNHIVFLDEYLLLSS